MKVHLHLHFSLPRFVSSFSLFLGASAVEISATKSILLRRQSVNCHFGHFLDGLESLVPLTSRITCRRARRPLRPPRARRPSCSLPPLPERARSVSRPFLPDPNLSSLALRPLPSKLECNGPPASAGSADLRSPRPKVHRASRRLLLHGRHTGTSHSQTIERTDASTKRVLVVTS